MSSAQPAAATVLEKLGDHLSDDQRSMLNVIIAETEKTRALLERDAAEQRSMEDVPFSSTGLIPKSMAGIWRMAKMFAGSKMVPEHFQNKPNDCCIAIQMALRCGADPMAFMQKCYVVHGRPSIEATLAVAMLHSSGLIRGRINYRMEGEGDKRKCTAVAILADTGAACENTVSVEIARKMGWYAKTGSLWPNMTDQMLMYRSATWLIRAYFPEVLFGLYTTEELRDMPESEAREGWGGSPEAIDAAGRVTAADLMGTAQTPAATEETKPVETKPAEEEKPKTRKKADKPKEETTPQQDPPAEEKKPSDGTLFGGEHAMTTPQVDAPDPKIVNVFKMRIREAEHNAELNEIDAELPGVFEDVPTLAMLRQLIAARRKEVS